MQTQAQLKAKDKYRREKTKAVSLTFYPAEMDLYEHLQTVGAKQTYIKDLIRKDMDSKFEIEDEYKKGRKEAYNHALDVVKAELKNMRNEIMQSKSTSRDYLDGYIFAISNLEWYVSTYEKITR